MRLRFIVLCLLVGCQDAGQQGEADSGPGDGSDARGRDGGDDVRILDAGDLDANAAVDAAVIPFDAAPVDHTLSVTTTIGGSVSVIVESNVVGTCAANQTCGFSLTEDTVVILTTTNETLSFCSWSGDCVGLGLCGLTMDGPKAVTANFQPGDQDCPP